MEELFGSSHPVTQEWSDGLVASIVRQAAEDPHPTRKWLVLDGPVDALWVENLNTVLDDNKLLCLANGERIKLPTTISLVFEVEDLSAASPATVSRCGMVYAEAVLLGWQPLLKSWEAMMGTRWGAFSDLAERVRAACAQPSRGCLVL